MRFLGIGDSCDLGALYQRLLREGHQVKVAVADAMAQGTMAGLVEHTASWENELDWVRAAGDEGIILFENVAEARGTLQDQLRKDGFRVIGGSAYGDRLENDRAYAQSVLAGIGLPTCEVREFDDVAAADDFLDRHPGRYVLKFNGPGFGSYENYVGRLPDGADIRAMLRARADQIAAEDDSFILMSHVEGVEMGVGAYFNGESFVGRACLDWEHKRFFPGDIGELTGEMGTVATFDRSDAFFERTLQRMTPLLRAGGYCGYINLNTIVNEQGIWPLEFTCRFGYPGFAVLGPLQKTGWGDLFAAMVGRRGSVEMRSGFSVAIVLTTPPFPYDRSTVDEVVGLPVCFDGTLREDEQDRLYYGEVGMVNGQLVTSGLYGWTMVATGQGATVAEAQRSALALSDRIIVPNMRFRRDIGDRVRARELSFVEQLGLLDPPEKPQRYGGPPHDRDSSAGVNASDMTLPHIKGVLETAIYVDDLERARTFYRDVLGLRSMHDDGRMTAYDAGPGSAFLVFARGASTRRIELPGGAIPGHDGHGPLHFAFAISAEDLPVWEQRLADHAVTVEDRVSWPKGGKSVYFRDPDGHLLELATPGLWSNY